MYPPKSAPEVICFGEMLWDCLPDGRHPGGAPLNVAYHLNKSGCTSTLVSAVGDDPAGDALLKCIREWGISTEAIGIRQSAPTGAVTVSLVNGQPSYTIENDVAWDLIEVPSGLMRRLGDIDAIVFGSLAARGAHNRNRLLRLLRDYRGKTVFDVNMRPPFDDHELVWELAQQASLIKLNDEELSALLTAELTPSNLEALTRAFAGKTACGEVCVTAGALGAGLLRDGQWVWQDAEPINVVDTIGAGDAFLAALLSQLLQRPADVDTALTTAIRLAGRIASMSGATPDW